MAHPRHLPQAPITEAVIDLRCRIDAAFDLEAFRALEGAIGYAAANPIHLFEFKMRQEVGKEPETNQGNHGLIGWRFTSEDGKHVAQFRKDGFTFSRLAPYTTWNEVMVNPRRRVMFSVGNDHQVAYAAIFGDETAQGVASFYRDIPQELSDLLSKLFYLQR